MPIKQVEVTIPKQGKGSIEKILEGDFIIDYWQGKLTGPSEKYLLKVLIDAKDGEQFLDNAEQLLGSYEGFRIVMTPVDATIPRIKEPKKNVKEKVSLQPWEQPLKGLRVSREELFSTISDGIALNRIYIAMVMLSTIVAALGILRDNTAVVIGAMVIAPILAPNIGLALATTLGDYELGIKSLRTNLAGLSIAFVISVIFGFFMNVDITNYEIAIRTEVHLSDISLALASGAAGVLAYTVGMSAAVIGVMVAVALLPPLVTSGLLLGNMQWSYAFFAFVLLMTNVICVNLAAVTTFIIQGVRPRTWYETKTAKKTNKIALTIWITLLLILGAIIFFTNV
jgi:uncharacterized hydrophobic protein (TIGR00341 family)